MPADLFSGCQDFGRVTTGVSNEEGNRAPVHLCHAPSGGWAAAWPRLVHLSA